MLNYYRDYEDAYERMCEERADAMLERALEGYIQDLEVWGRDAYAEEMALRDAFGDDEVVQVFTEQEWNDRSAAEFREMYP